MIRDLKVLGLALAAVFVLGAVAASAASAQNGMLTSDGPVTIIGEGDDSWSMFGIKTTCANSVFTGHEYNVTPHEPVPNGASTITYTPHYKQTNGPDINCLASIFPATIDMNNCDFIHHIGSTISTHTYSITVDIVCPAGQEITKTIFTTKAEDPSTPFCIIHVPAQNGLTGLKAVDNTNGTVDILGTISGVRATRTNHGAHGLLCPNNTSTEGGTIAVEVSAQGHNQEGEPTDMGLSHF